MFLKKNEPIKNIGNIYHIRVNKNLKDTKGIVDVIHVINIQNKYRIISSVIGFVSISLKEL